MINERNRYHLSKFHKILVLIICCILITVLMRFFDIFEASMEELSVEISIMNTRQMIYYQNILSKSSSDGCAFLNDPNFLGSSSSLEGDMEANNSAWKYDNKKHLLIYNVRSKRYFRSQLKQKIVLALYCKKGIIQMKASKFQWCQNKAIWGCKSW